MSSYPDPDPNVSRREFIGSATLTTAGVAAGLSFYFSRPHRNDDEVARLEKEENRVRLGFIGVGNRGMSLLRSALQVPGCRAVAVADVRESQRAEAVKDIKASREKAGEPDVKVESYDDYRRLLDSKEVEAIFIATPHYLHGSMALDAIEAGKHIYCEKAMAYTIGENQDIHDRVTAGARTADGHLLVFQVGHQRHYAPLYRKVKEMIAMDVIGDVVAIRAQWNSNDPVRRACPDPAEEKLINWRLYSEFSGGLTTEFASHQIDVANWILGTHPDSVCGLGGVDWYADGRDTHDNIHLIFNYKMPVVERDGRGRPKLAADGKTWLHRKDGERTLYRNVRFDYMSLMQNEHLRASEMILGTTGTIEVSLTGGGEFFKEKKALSDDNRIAEGTNPKRSHQKRILKTGSTVDPNQASIRRPSGEPIRGEKDKTHWVQYTDAIHGAYDTHETLLAISGFADSIRRSREGKDFKDTLAADVEVGLWGAVPSLMANIAMREERTVHWSEFFPASQTASPPGKASRGLGTG
jgi:predicted dehydrogenase